MTHFTAKTALTALAFLTLTPGLAQGTPGAFHALGAPTTGSAAIVQKNGQATLELRGLKTEPGPDLQVWLYQNAAPQKGAKDADIGKGKYVKVGELKKFNGNFSYPIPKGTNVTGYKSVVIWCEQVKTAFGAADLQ
ncbi:hypothetical protein DAETH_38060 (plasmid) [Deinococcus aetherius]|uniref:DM13 domain-containing protein n=1 Tax=Deinococcus aetherius TaxID=200252 RepID=A0ABM8AJ35_9DEIO|nr:DM13 domain-containing protein [Deinococcus aetherius]BDP43837.1 hypothetical protein DAETH_38060 [Deinococcus aetherius]